VAQATVVALFTDAVREGNDHGPKHQSADEHDDQSNVAHGHPRTSEEA
jgi:hypothetical protein